MNQAIIETKSTEAAAALLAVGFDLTQKNPFYRIFDDNHPPRPGTGLARGGRIVFRIDAESGPCNADAAYRIYQREDGQTESSEINDELDALSNRLAGTDEGMIVKKIRDLLPFEFLRVIKVAFLQRRELFKWIEETPEMVEYIARTLENGDTLIANAKLGRDGIKQLLQKHYDA